MRRAKGSYCGDFRSPAQPFVSRPFYGRYSSSPPGGYYAPAPQYTPGYTPPAYTPPAAPQYTPPAPAPAPAPAPTPAPAPAPTAATGGAGATAASGGQRYPPTLYESAPQGAPATGGVAAGTG
jgi:hypothetical protein